MSDQYVGEIRVFGFGIVPRGWAKCDGSLLTIQQNQALYSLLGVKFGGNGTTNFALPDLRGRVPIHPQPTQPDANEVGEKGGAETVALNAATMPLHNHNYMAASVPGTAAGPGPNNNRVLSVNSITAGDNVYATTGPFVILGPDACTPFTGAAQPHNNVQPSLAVNICIALTGIYPSRN